MIRNAVLVGLALFAAACGPKNYVVLLDDPGGGSGKVFVTNDEGKQVLDKSGSATTFNRRGKAPSTPWEVGVEKIRETFARAFGARPSRFGRFVVYFRLGTDKLEPASEPRLRALIDDVRRRPGVDVTVSGHADRLGDDKLNEKLSTKRAYLVRDLLIRYGGVPVERIEMDAFGESLPAIPTDDEVPEARNRRVEVTVR